MLSAARRSPLSFPPALASAVLSRAINSLALLALAIPSGCDDDESSTSTEQSITIQEDRSFSFDDSTYDWNSPGDVARLRLDVDDFNQGDMRITVFDSRGIRIYQETYYSFDWVWYIDGEYSDVSFTAPGAAGLWTIQIEYENFTGEITLVVESTAEPPPDPEVPPPAANSDLLDLAFGTDGRATFEEDTTAGRRLAVDSADRIVVVGSILEVDGDRSLVVYRFLSTGALDPAFATGGVYRFTAAGVTRSGGFDVAIDSNDRPVVSGWSSGASERTDLVVLRLTTAGALDGGFGTGGVATFDDGEDEAGFGVAIDSADRIVVAGTSRNADTTVGHVILARYSDAGVADGGFGTAGIVRTADDTDRGLDVALAADDSPIVLGLRDGDLALWKFTTAGAPDGGFGVGGITRSVGEMNEFRVGTAIIVKGDGTLAVAGFRYFSIPNPAEMAVWRFAADGNTLAEFTGDGLVTFAFPGGRAVGTGVAFDAADRVLVCGVTRSESESTSDASASLWRFLESGLLDTSLPGSDASGVARFDERTGNAGTSASAMTILANGRLLISGAAFDRAIGAADLVLWKLRP